MIKKIREFIHSHSWNLLFACLVPIAVFLPVYINKYFSKPPKPHISYYCDNKTNIQYIIVQNENTDSISIIPRFNRNQTFEKCQEK